MAEILSKDVKLTEEELDYIADALLDHYDPDNPNKPVDLYNAIVGARRIGIGEVGRFGF